MRPGDRSLDTTPLDNTADVVVTPALEAETERLLSQRTRDIRFSPEMVRAYRQKDWPQRSKIARAWMVWVALISIAFVPLSYLLAPDFLLLTTAVAGLLVPVLHGCAYLVWRKPRSAAAKRRNILAQFLLEALFLSLVGGLIGVAFGLAGCSFVHSVKEWKVAVAPESIILAFSFSAFVGIFFGFEIFNPAIDLKEAIGTSVFFAMGIFASTIARKTQSILGQKAFLLTLRNQYRSDALKSANHQLEILATRDPLTGLGNRRSATDLVDRLWCDPTIPKARIAFIMADIDLFKLLNDAAGHAAGDECIRRIARTIEESVRLGEDAV